MHLLWTMVFVVTAAAGAATEPMARVHIQISGNPPFSADELTQALIPRLPPESPADTLFISERADGLVELAWQGRTRAVDLKGEHGATAARVVALLAADLLPTNELPFVAPTAARSLPPPAPATEAKDPLTFALGYHLWSSNGYGPLLQGPGLGVGLDRRQLRLRADAAWLEGTPRAALDLFAWPVRIGAGLGTSYLSALTSLVIVPYRLEGLANRTRTLIGAGLGLESRFALGAGFSLHVDVGADLFVGKRLRVVGGDRVYYESPIWALRFGAGLAWRTIR